MTTLPRILLALSLLLGVTSAVDTLVIGDSYADYGKTYWATYCGMTVLNKGVGGTTSVQWAAGDTMKDAYDQAKEAKNILFTIGGNDFMGIAPKCGYTRAQVKTTILKSLNILANLVKAAGKNQKITMLGYAMPTAKFPTDEGECPGSKPAMLEALNGGMQDACKEVGATFIDMRDIAGATANTWSALSTTAGSFHADQVHLNEMGYCKVATTDAFRTRFACSVKKADQSCNSKTAPKGEAAGSSTSSAGRASGGHVAALLTATAAAMFMA